MAETKALTPAFLVPANFSIDEVVDPAVVKAQAATPFPPPFRGRRLKGFPLGISSSQIRARVKAGLPIAHLVPEGVAEAIRNNRLYL